ncbi:hypothetical protein ABZ897_16345 [Nonomuraea sp. NPDC046802]|uniref:hypothetical protein n=1 Tax=Nonomuraea sp. NPDC046802 TaxID=3154919 RepID=UPI0033C72C80
MGIDLGLGYLDIRLFTLAQWDIGLRAPWWAIGLGALALIFVLTKLIQAFGRNPRPPATRKDTTMGFFFGNKTSLGYPNSARLAKKITKKGGRSSSGAAAVLDIMSGRTNSGRLRGEEAEQAARSLREIAPHLNPADRADVLAIADDAEHASNNDGGWNITG